jgi:hypothetical protein
MASDLKKPSLIEFGDDEQPDTIQDAVGSFIIKTDAVVTA